jgi:hypothetical protein
MTQELTKANGAAAVPLSQNQVVAADIEQVLIAGDLAQLKPPQRVEYYGAVCRSIGLNPLTKPFEYINLNGKLRLYATKDCTEQLRTIHGISVTIVGRDLVEDVWVVTARAIKKDGRQDEAIGAVNIGGLKGENKANALMKAETKAKRRVTLSICGLGMLDESEVSDIPGAYPASETREELVQRRIAEVQAGKAPEPVQEATPEQVQRAVDTTPEPRGDWFKKMLHEFSLMKQTLPEEEYYGTLQRWGIEHTNQIPNRQTAKQIYHEMALRRAALNEA